MKLNYLNGAFWEQHFETLFVEKYQFDKELHFFFDKNYFFLFKKNVKGSTFLNLSIRTEQIGSNFLSYCLIGNFHLADWFHQGIDSVSFEGVKMWKVSNIDRCISLDLKVYTYQCSLFATLFIFSLLQKNTQSTNRPL